MWIYLSSLFRLAEAANLPFLWSDGMKSSSGLHLQKPGTVTGVRILLAASMSSNLGLQIAVCMWYQEFGTGFSSVEQGSKGEGQSQGTDHEVG